MKNTFKIIITQVFIFLFVCLVQGQSFLNLNFEYSLPNGAPRKWAIEGEGKHISGQITQKEVYNGVYGFHLKITNATAFAHIPVELKNTNKISFSIEGEVKSPHKDSISFQIMLMNPTIQKRIMSKQIPITENWSKFAFNTVLPSNWNFTLMALMVSGTGNVYFDDLILKVNNIPIGNDQPDFRQPTPKEIKTLNEEAIPLSQIKHLRNNIMNANLVGLGENSHGSASIFNTKLQILKYLITKMGFTVFALEMPVAEANFINQYVQGKHITKNEVVQNLVYKSWQTHEMMEIIDWLRTYNKTATKKVLFYGFDMQYADKKALDELITYHSSKDEELYSLLTDFKNTFKKSLINNAGWSSTLEKAKKINLSLNRSPKLMQYYGNLLLQTISSYYNYEGARNRDWYMAQNIKWLVDSLPDDTKIVLSADNTHLTKTGKSVGKYLKNIYRNNYIVFGFTYESGTYSAVQPDGVYNVHQSYVGTYEFLLSKCNLDNFYIDIRTTRIPYLRAKNDFRLIGSRPQQNTQFTIHDLKEHFDIIVYLTTSKHTKFINQ